MENAVINYIFLPVSPGCKAGKFQENGLQSHLYRTGNTLSCTAECLVPQDKTERRKKEEGKQKGKKSLF